MASGHPSIDAAETSGSRYSSTTRAVPSLESVPSLDVLSSLGGTMDVVSSFSQSSDPTQASMKASDEHILRTPQQTRDPSAAPSRDIFPEGPIQQPPRQDIHSRQQLPLFDTDYAAFQAQLQQPSQPQYFQASPYLPNASTSTPHNAFPQSGGLFETYPSTSIASSSSSSSASSAALTQAPSTSAAPRMDATELLRVLRTRPKDTGQERPVACDRCRARRIKCDRAQPTCSTCKRLGRRCARDDVLRKRGPPSTEDRAILHSYGLYLPETSREKRGKGSSETTSQNSQASQRESERSRPSGSGHRRPPLGQQMPQQHRDNPFHQPQFERQPVHLHRSGQYPQDSRQQGQQNTSAGHDFPQHYLQQDISQDGQGQHQSMYYGQQYGPQYAQQLNQQQSRQFNQQQQNQHQQPVQGQQGSLGSIYLSQQMALASDDYGTHRPSPQGFGGSTGQSRAFDIRAAGSPPGPMESRLPLGQMEPAMNSNEPQAPSYNFQGEASPAPSVLSDSALEELRTTTSPDGGQGGVEPFPVDPLTGIHPDSTSYPLLALAPLPSIRGSARPIQVDGDAGQGGGSGGSGGGELGRAGGKGRKNV